MSPPDDDLEGRLPGIRNAAELATTPARRTAIACLEAGLRAGHPRAVVPDAVRIEGDELVVAGARYDLASVDRVLVLGGGKAAPGVASALEAVLGDRLTGGAVVGTEPAETTAVEGLVGDHPVPSARSVAATRRVLDLAAGADASTLVLAVVAGGGSALLAAPAAGVELGDLQSVTEALLAAGASIHELNAVRSHCSAVKGGGLARAATPARTVGLVVSDVVGDDPGVVASGPTAPDPSTYAEARAVLDRYHVRAPAAVRDRLAAGVAGELPETPDASVPVFERVANHVIASNATALAAAREVAVARGYEPCLLSSRLRGEARAAAPTVVAVAEEVRASGNPVRPPAVLLAGGECTVRVTGPGRGGPNLEFALAAAIELADDAGGSTRIALASVDTDGVDGTARAAGGLVDPTTVADVVAARAALDANDAEPFLAERGALVLTGPTGTNLNDLRVVVVEAEP